MKKLISDFLKKFCVLADDDGDAFCKLAELYEDTHSMIQYEGNIYHMPKKDPKYTEDDEFIREILFRLYDFC